MSDSTVTVVSYLEKVFLEVKQNLFKVLVKVFIFNKALLPCIPSTLLK